MELTDEEVESLKSVLSYLDEEDDFLTWIGHGEGKPVDWVTEEEWDKEVTHLLDLEEASDGSPESVKAYQDQLSEVATITVGHVYGDIVRLRDKLGL
jgi:hypothetical protein